MHRHPFTNFCENRQDHCHACDPSHAFQVTHNKSGKLVGRAYTARAEEELCAFEWHSFGRNDPFNTCCDDGRGARDLTRVECRRCEPLSVWCHVMHTQLCVSLTHRVCLCTSGVADVSERSKRSVRVQVDASFPLDAHVQEQELTDTRFSMCTWLDEDTLALIFGKALHYLFVLKSVSKLWSTIIRGKISVRTMTSTSTVVRSISLLKWALEMGYQWNKSTSASAAREGNLDVLKWAHEQGCPWDAAVCEKAAFGGHLDVLKWAIEHGCPWDEGVFQRDAARAGHLHVLKWAREKEMPWDERVCKEAAAGGHLDVLKWLIENGCAWDARVFTRAASHGHLHILKWAYEEGMSWDEAVLVCALAASGGHLNVLKWAREEGVFSGMQWCAETCTTARRNMAISTC